MNPIYAWYFVLVAWTCCHFVATKHISLSNIKSTKIRRRENWARSFLLFIALGIQVSSFGPVQLRNRWWTRMSSSKVMLSKHKIQSPKLKHLIILLSNSCFLFSTCFPLVNKKKHNFCFGVNRKPSTKKLPAPPANLGSCRPGPVVQPTCLGDPKNPPTFNPVRCSSDFRQPRLSSISTKSQGLKKCPRVFWAVHSQASLKNAKNVMMDKWHMIFHDVLFWWVFLNDGYS